MNAGDLTLVKMVFPYNQQQDSDLTESNSAFEQQQQQQEDSDLIELDSTYDQQQDSVLTESDSTFSSEEEDNEEREEDGYVTPDDDRPLIFSRAYAFMNYDHPDYVEPYTEDSN